MRTKRLACAIGLAWILACGSAFADVGLQGWGPRLGLSEDPDQFVAGAHWDLGEFAPHWRFQPSVDFGFGDDVLSFSGNAMAAYYFPVKSSSITPYAGGQLTASWFDFDQPGGNSDSDTEVGLGAVGGIETKLKSGKRFLAEIQIGLGDIADFKIFAAGRSDGIVVSLMRRRGSFFSRALAVATCCVWTRLATVASAEPMQWLTLETGLEMARAPVPAGAHTSGDSIPIVRVDPVHWDFRLLNASARGEGQPLTARDWSLQHDLAAVINASMYQVDRRTSVSLMKTADHTNNARVSKDRAVLAFDRVVLDVPAIQIIDRDCQELETLRPRYGTLVQSIRMVSCEGRNVWSKQARPTSIACLAMDRQGRVLLIHSRTPRSPHDLVEILLAAPLQIRNAMYLEGGPEAQLYVRAGGKEMEFVGRSDLDLLPDETRPAAWRVPNVLGVARHPAPPQRADLP